MKFPSGVRAGIVARPTEVPSPEVDWLAILHSYAQTDRELLYVWIKSAA
jgi:hypothetical protein